MVAKWCLGYAPRVLLYAANLRHGTDNFTSLPKEGVLRIFIALKKSDGFGRVFVFNVPIQILLYNQSSTVSVTI